MYIFRRTAEILSAQLKILGATSSLSINYVGMSKDMGKRVPQLYYIKMKMSHEIWILLQSESPWQNNEKRCQ